MPITIISKINDSVQKYRHGFFFVTTFPNSSMKSTGKMLKRYPTVQNSTIKPTFGKKTFFQKLSFPYIFAE
jgi:hypothetical protein